MKKKTCCALIVFLTLMTVFFPVAFAEELQNKRVVHEEPSKKVTGMVDMNYTYDTRDMNRLTFDVGANFSHGLSYYAFINLNSQMAVNGSNFDIDTYYHEQDFWWHFYQSLPLDLAFQYQSLSGPGNDQARFGFRWRISDTDGVKSFFETLHLFLYAQAHPLQTDFDPSPGWGLSFEYFWHWEILPILFQNRVYMAGVVDHNLDFGGTTNGNNHSIVFENQMGVRVIDNFNIIAEYRFSDYDTKQQGVGFGLEYKINF